MWSLFKWIFGTLSALLTSIAIFFFTNWILGKEFPNLPGFILFLSTNKIFFIIGIVLFVILALISFQKETLKNLEKKVWFYKSTARLRPSDINPSKFWYDPFFIERPEVDYTVKMLTSGQGVVLLGVPLIGKTRCAYEALKRLRRCRVMGVTPEKQDVSEIKIPRSYLLFKPKLIILIDDLQRYIEKISLVNLVHHLHKQSKSITILGTCRSGEEFTAVLRDQAFSSFIQQNLQTTYIYDISKDEEKTLATHFQRNWSETAYNGTPGSIVFGLETMRQRLLATGIETKTLMRSLYLLNMLGIQTYRRVLAENVAKTIYELSSTRLNIEHNWQWLKEAGFLEMYEEKIILTHMVYIESSFYPDYELGDTEKDLISLRGLVLSLGKPGEFIEVALEELGKGQFNNAEMFFKKYLEVEPDDSGALFGLGVSLEKQGETKQAEQAYRKAIKYKADIAGFHFQLASVLQEQALLDEAESEYLEAIRLDPYMPAARHNLGLILRKQGRISEAELEYREAIRLSSDYADAHHSLGQALMDLSRLDEAEREFRDAIRLNPNAAFAHLGLGVLLERQLRIKEAEQSYRKAIHFDSTLAEAHYGLSVVMMMQNQLNEAERELREAIHYDPNSALAHCNLGSLLSNQEQDEAAEDELRKAINCDPNLVTAHHNLAVLLAKHEDIQEAEKEFSEAIRCNPDFASSHLAFGWMLFELNRLDEAEVELREAVRCNPADEQAHSNLGVILGEQGRLEEAENEFREAIRINPHHSGLHNNLSRVLHMQGRIEEARIESREAMLLMLDNQSVKEHSPRWIDEQAVVFRIEEESKEWK